MVWVQSNHGMETVFLGKLTWRLLVVWVDLKVYLFAIWVTRACVLQDQLQGPLCCKASLHFPLRVWKVKQAGSNLSPSTQKAACKFANVVITKQLFVHRPEQSPAPLLNPQVTAAFANKQMLICSCQSHWFVLMGLLGRLWVFWGVGEVLLLVLSWVWLSFIRGSLSR